MQFILEGHSYEHDLFHIANLFFTKKEDVTITSRLINPSDGMLVVETEINYENNLFHDKYTYKFTPTQNERLIKRYTVTALAKSVANIGQQIKKVTLPWGVMSGIRPAKIVRQYLEEGLTDAQVHNVLNDIYNVTEEKISLALTVAKNEIALTNNLDDNAISLYIGIPFCPTRCLYCSFVSNDITKNGKYIDKYIDLLVKEIEYTADLLSKTPYYIENIYIGGGTPTSVSTEHIKKYLTAIKTSFDLSRLKEYTLEAGRPDTITEEKLVAIKESKVNRISINPQTMVDKTLELIGRKHTSNDIVSAFDLTRKIGFNNINADLIIGLPDETEKDFKYSLEKVLSLSPENITIHTMSLKKGSRLKEKFENMQITHTNTVENMLSIAQNTLLKADYEPYYMYRQKNMLGNLENVGYAKKGYTSVYNVNIMEEVQSILALGAGGVSKVVNRKTEHIERVFNFKDAIEYINRFDEILERKTEAVGKLNNLLERS